MDVNNPHWVIPTLIGALLGFFLPYLLALPKYAWSLFHPHTLQGRWYHYFYQYQDGRQKLKSEIWEIKRGLFRPLRVKVHAQNDGEPTYKGFVSFEKNFFIVKMKSTKQGHDEDVIQRFKIPVAALEKKCIGVSIAQDYEGNAAAGANVLSSVSLSDEDVSVLLRKKIKIYERERTMHVIESGEAA